ncbi:hypothetical protein [Mesorhizobium sp.]|uniref:hypothetical protein n=1 Tax=Mesorhizobium sp. TaxID=1871066 RepID=UPI000FE41126|nr:hypothetical protein [Mesorhizobium sp.]RWQ16111.1 MAG: hypothetical protein EOR92_22825 [Mesorhizobium sp.]
MTINERSSLEQQATDARSRLDSLLRQREGALEGRALAPKPEEIAETAERLLRAHERMTYAR